MHPHCYKEAKANKQSAGGSNGKQHLGGMAPMIYIPEAYISKVSLTKVSASSQKKEVKAAAPRCIVLMAWIEYDLDYLRSHSPVKPSDVRTCINAALQDHGVATEVHAVWTRETKNDGKGFRKKIDVWVALSNTFEEDEYMVPCYLALDAEIYEVIQAKAWKEVCNNELAGRLKVAFPANNSTVDMPKFMLMSFAAKMHRTARQQMKHLAEALYRGMNEDFPPSYKFNDLLDWLQEVGARWGFFNPTDGKTICVLMLTFKKRSLAGELLRKTYKDKSQPGINILGMRHKLIPFPPREDKATKRKVGKALREFQQALKELREVCVPRVDFLLSAANKVTLVSNLPHCVSLSTFLMCNELRYSVMVSPDPESAAYTTENVTDGIQRAFPEMIDDT